MAGRPKIGGVRMPVQLGEGVAERIDAVAGPGQRSEYIRGAVVDRLERDEGGSVRPAERQPEPSGPRDSDGEALAAHRRPAAREELPARKPVSKAQEESQKRFLEGRDRQHQKMQDEAAVRKALGGVPIHRRELLKRLGWMEMKLDKVLARMKGVQFREGLVWLEG